MENRHRLRFVFRRAGFDERAEKHLQKAPADRVDHNGNQQSDKGIWEQFGQKNQRRHADDNKRVSDKRAGAISHPVDQKDGQQIDAQLYDEIHRN